MNHKQLQQPTKFDQQPTVFKKDREQWWSLGEVKSRLSKKKKPFYFKVGKWFVVFLLLAALIAAIFMQPEKDKEVEVKEPYYQESEQALTPLQQEIQDLKSQLEDADPSIKELSLPNINMNLTIDRM